MLFGARLFALGDARLPITHRRHAFFFALEPSVVACGRTRGAGRFGLLVVLLFRSCEARVDDEQHGWRGQRGRRFGNGVRSTRFTRQFLRGSIVTEAQSSEPHGRVVDTIRGLSKRIKLEPFVPARDAHRGFDISGVFERHAVLEANIAFVQRVNARATRGEAAKTGRSQCLTNDPRCPADEPQGRQCTGQG